MFQGTTPDSGPWWLRLWKKRWAKPGFHHVSLAGFDPDGSAWIIIEAHKWGIECRAKSALYGFEDILTEHRPTTWLPVRRSRSLDETTTRGPITCVSVVKAVLGERCRAITPYQLYRHLLEVEGYEQA